MSKKPRKNKRQYDYDYEYDDYDDYEYDDEYLEYQQNKAIKKKKKRKKRKLIRKFFTIMFSIVFIYFGALGAYIGYTYLNDDAEDDYFSNHTGLNVFSGIFGFSDIPERTTVLLTGVDADETRTDSIMLLEYNSISNEINLISIPRDSLVKIPDDRFKFMEETMQSNLSNPMKINHIHAYSGDRGMEFLELQIEETLGINIDYYAKVNCEAFRYIVDSIGGVEFNVKERLYYNDPAQDLHINLYPGQQLLDGDKAEQLVRNRYSYALQDIDRVKVQQEFMKALISTILNKDTVMSNPEAYITAIIKYVDTNFGITDAVNYLSVLKNIDTSNMHNYTLPGESKDGSTYTIDEEETSALVYEIFKKPSSSSSKDKDGHIDNISSKEKSIIIQNGGYTSGLAGKAKKSLEKDGFTVSSIGDYNGEKKKDTRIYISKEGMGEDLKDYFTSSEIILNKSMTTDCDILIILGTEEKLNN